jgi:hypothetical protein
MRAGTRSSIALLNPWKLTDPFATLHLQQKLRDVEVKMLSKDYVRTHKEVQERKTLHPLLA